MVKMDVLQAGANVAVTQLKSNNCDEGQLCFFFFFFSLLCCSVQETGQSFKASSFLTLTQWQGERRKKSVLLPHSHRKFIILLSVCRLKRSQERKTIVSGARWAVTPCVSWPPSLNLFSPFAHTHTLTLFNIPLRL